MMPGPRSLNIRRNRLCAGAAAWPSTEGMLVIEGISIVFFVRTREVEHSKYDVVQHLLKRDYLQIFQIHKCCAGIANRHSFGNLGFHASEALMSRCFSHRMTDHINNNKRIHCDQKPPPGRHHHRRPQPASQCRNLRLHIQPGRRVNFPVPPRPEQWHAHPGQSGQRRRSGQPNGHHA
ncbi:hypothetical protein D3C73_969830 [compost metagenome]